MLRTLTRLGLAVATLLLFTTVQAGPARAEDASGCRIAPGPTSTFTPSCRNERPASSYSVAFHVQAPVGTTFAWTLTGDWTAVVTGCGAADAYCTVSTGGSNQDRGVQAAVTAGAANYFIDAAIAAYCGRVYC